MLMFTAWMGFFTVRGEAELPIYGKIDDSNIKQYLNLLEKGFPIVWLSLSGAEDLDAEADKYSAHVHEAASQSPHHFFVWTDAMKWDDRSLHGLGCEQYPCVSLMLGRPADEEGKAPNVILFTEPLDLASGGIPAFLENVVARKIHPRVPNDSKIAS